MTPRWAHRLLDAGVISREQLDDAERAAVQRDVPLDKALIEWDYVTAEEIARANPVEPGMEVVALERRQIDPAVVRMLPTRLALEYAAIPIGFRGGVLFVAVSHLASFKRARELGPLIGREIQFVQAHDSSVRDALVRHYFALHVCESGGAFD